MNEGLSSQNGALERRITSLLRDRLHLEVSSPDAELLATGVIDSLGLVELLVLLEEQFQIRVAPEDLDPEQFQSISRMAVFIRREGLRHHHGEGQ